MGLIEAQCGLHALTAGQQLKTTINLVGNMPIIVQPNSMAYHNVMRLNDGFCGFSGESYLFQSNLDLVQAYSKEPAKA